MPKGFQKRAWILPDSKIDRYMARQSQKTSQKYVFSSPFAHGSGDFFSCFAISQLLKVQMDFRLNFQLYE